MLDITPVIFLGFCKMIFIDESGEFLREPVLTLDPKITTQDDPFDRWVVRTIEQMGLPDLKVFSAGPLTHPDTVLRYKSENGEYSYLGLEIKKLNADARGNDPRGMTLDYNSTIPCGTFRVYKSSGEHLDVKGYYFYALLDHLVDQLERRIYTFVLCDGDLLNDDVELYVRSKTANISEYGHGPYGEGSIRKRAMYLYPNPLNSKIPELARQVSLIHASPNLEMTYPELVLTHTINRKKTDGTEGRFHIYKHASAIDKPANVPVIGMFIECAERGPKKRSAYKFVLRE